MMNITKISITKMKRMKFSAVIGCLLLSFISAFVVQAQEESEFFPIPENYKTEGVPPIKKSEVEHLLFDPSAIKSNLIWDTDRKNRRLLVTDETNNVYLLNTPLTQPVQLFEKIVPSSVKMRPDGNSFAFTSDYEDEDNYQLYIYNFNDKVTKKLTVLTGKDESVESFVWNKDGTLLTYTKVGYDTKTSKICQSDLTSERCFLADLKGIWYLVETSGNKILLKYWKASSSQFLYVYDTQTEKLIPIDEKGNSRKGFFLGDRVFWTSEGNENCKKEPCILSFDLKKGNLSQVRLPENLSNLNEVKISPEGGNLLIQETKDGVDNLRVFRLKKGKLEKEYPSFISGSFVIWNTRWLSDDEVVYTLENIGKPASIQSFNLKTGKTTDWTKERLPSQLENKVEPPKIIKWKTFDGKEISGYAVRPKTAEKKTPVLVYVHGGPQILDTPGFNSQEIRLASNLGITIIHTNIRGSNGFGKAFMDADNKEKRGDAIKDIQSLFDWIKKQPDLDADQIYLRGESYGGFVVLSAALQEPERVKGVIAESPLISIPGFLAQSWIDEFATNEYGDPKDEALMKQLSELSPLGNTDRWNKIPLLLTRGKLDSRIPERDVIDLKNQLQIQDSEVWFIFANEAGHGFGSRYVTAAMYQFLKKQIKKNKQETKTTK